MCNNLETIFKIICIITIVAIYIYRKVTGDMWYGINWNYLFRIVRKFLSKR